MEIIFQFIWVNNVYVFEWKTFHFSTSFFLSSKHLSNLFLNSKFCRVAQNRNFFKRWFHCWCQISFLRAIPSSLETRNGHCGLNPDHMVDEKQFIVQLTEFRHSDYGHVHPCIVLLKEQLLLDKCETDYTACASRNCWNEFVDWQNYLGLLRR